MKIDNQIKRKYFSNSFRIKKWQDLKIELEKLLSYPINSSADLIEFWKKVSELDKIMEDTVAWLYVKMTRFSNNPEYREAFTDFIKNIEAKSRFYGFELNKKFYSSLFRANLPKEYKHLNKIISNEIEIFREKNIPLLTKEQKLAVKFREIVGKMTVVFQGKKKTIQQMQSYLENENRELREEAWRLIYKRYAKDEKKLNKLFDELKDIRVRIAKNAGFKNYRDYIHQAKGRFSYSSKDLIDLHKIVKKIVVPFVEEINKERKVKMNLDSLRPWDFDVSIDGKIPSVSGSVEGLLKKSTNVLAAVNSEFGKEFKKIRDRGFIDAENRAGKAPGGYCYPILELGSSFIFMHAVGTTRDVRTVIHEAGHAMHNMMERDEPIINYLIKPSEIAELASMGMELISLDHWSEFYSEDILKIVKRNELLDKIKFIPWGVVVDAFQHWIYLNPAHTAKERSIYFSKLLKQYKIGGNWDGLEKEKAIRWMMQLHIFEMPFYYIEYVLAQLGAVAIYCNYKKNPQKTVEQYKNFLKAAYSKPVSQIYKTAGIDFDFSEKYILKLLNFIRKELERG